VNLDGDVWSIVREGQISERDIEKVLSDSE